MVAGTQLGSPGVLVCISSCLLNPSWILVKHWYTDELIKGNELGLGFDLLSGKPASTAKRLMTSLPRVALWFLVF